MDFDSNFESPIDKNLQNAKFHLENDGTKHFLYLNASPLLTPYGNQVAHESRALMQNMLNELECQDYLDVTTLSTYSVFSTLTDFGDKFYLGEENIQSLLLGESVLKAITYVENLEQFNKWDALFENLELLEMDRDCFRVPELGDSGDEYRKSIDKLARYFYNEFLLLSKPQKAVVVNVVSVHRTFIYGFYLATRKCTEMEYTAAVLAGQNIFPDTTSGVTKEDYKVAFYQMLTDANLLTNFLRATVTLNHQLSKMVRNQLPNWGLLPEGARIALTEAMNKIHEINSNDYSSYVVLLAKSLEISLKQMIFDEFQRKYSKVIREHQNVSVFIQDNHQVIKLAKYLVKHPHFIELGTMLTVLEKYDKRSTMENKLLGDFFAFIEIDIERPAILSKSFIEKAFEVSRCRNSAAHSQSFSHDEAKAIQSLTFDLLSIL